MSALPLNLIKGTRSTAYERLENTEDIEEVEQHIQTIRSKVSSASSLEAWHHPAVVVLQDASLPLANLEPITLFKFRATNDSRIMLCFHFLRIHRMLMTKTSTIFSHPDFMCKVFHCLC